jgi:hypothetical protein
MKQRRTGGEPIPRSAEFDLLQSIHDLMKIENQLRSIGDKQSVGAIETLSLECVEFLEEGWEVYDHAVAD